MRGDESHMRFADPRHARVVPHAWVPVALLAVAVASCAPPARLPPPKPSSSTTNLAPGCLPGTVVAPRVRIGLPRHGTARTLGHEALANALSRRLGLPVEVVLLDRYDEIDEGLANGFLEVAMLPPLEYVKARDRDPCVAARLTLVFDGTVHYSSYLVTRKDSGLTGLRQLVGHSVAFVDQTSASGWLFPVARLSETSVDPFRSLSDVLFLGNHRAVIEAVIDGRASAGATYPGALEGARRDGLDVGSLAILGIAGRIPHDAVVVRPDIDPAQARAIIDALAGLNSTTAEGRAALSFSEGLGGFVPSSDRSYDQVREVVRQVGRFAGGTP